jgi:aspartyl-tRNA(Asn)/glutamyl-tRNA(Gln) amidotransferase subunit B
VIANNPKQVEQYRSGKASVINFLVGQAMKATRGQANVALLTELFKSKLG